ncbi:MAG: hypothetical protein Q7K55_00935 [Candidatus Levybacteria bacterium]|nr:hypothetical protein [Candidatus Levybacteria bacterium]
MEESNLDQNPNIQSQNNIPQAQQPVQPVEKQLFTQSPPPGGKSKLPMMLIGFFILLIILGSSAYYYLEVNKTSENKACPDIARICSDSSTAKPGPNCQQSCPEDSLSLTLTQKPITDETANPDSIGVNWKTYTDSKDGIVFKYPSNWYTQPNPVGILVFLDNHPFEIPGGTEFMTPIQIGFNEAENTTTNEKFFIEKTLDEGEKRILSLYDSKSVQVKNLTISGKKSVQISGVFGPGMLEGHYFKYTLIQMDNKLLVVSLNNKEFDHIYNQILSTFKFTENVAPTESAGKSAKTLAHQLPSNWQTIKDISGKFEVGYDPSQYTVNALQSRIDLNSKQCCASIFVKLLPYDGASRHQFISKNTGALKLPNTIEKEYLVSGKTALFQYNVDYSSVVTVGMVVANNSEAWLIESTTSNQAVIEQFISTLKLIN